MDVKPGQAVIAHKGEWVQYSTPEPEGADYIAVCVPAFAMDKYTGTIESLWLDPADFGANHVTSNGSVYRVSTIEE